MNSYNSQAQSVERNDGGQREREREREREVGFLRCGRTGPPRVLRLAGDRPDHDLSPLFSSPLLDRCVPCHRWRRFSSSFILSLFPFRFSRVPSRRTDWTIHHRLSSLSRLRPRVPPPSRSPPCLSLSLPLSFRCSPVSSGTILTEEPDTRSRAYVRSYICTYIGEYISSARGIHGARCLGRYMGISRSELGVSVVFQLVFFFVSSHFLSFFLFFFFFFFGRCKTFS